MTAWGRRLATVGAALYLLLTTFSALQHRLHPMVSERMWYAVGVRFPSLAFGYLMFDNIPDRIPYYRLSVGEQPVLAGDIDHNSAFGYANARFQINALLNPEYLRDVCGSSDRSFLAELRLREISFGRESAVRRFQCRGHALQQLDPPLRQED